MAYDTTNHLIQASNTIGQQVNFYYNANGTLNRYWKYQATVGGEQFGFRYDTNNRILYQVTPEGRIPFANTYDNYGRISAQRDAYWNFSYFYYDLSQPNALITQVVDPFGGTNTFVHNSDYELISKTDQLGNTTGYAYDTNGNQLAITNALGSVSQFTYDSSGNVINSKDNAGMHTYFGYDGANNLLSITNANGDSQYFAYDANNNLIESVDYSSNHIWMAYDKDSIVTNIVYQRGGAQRFIVSGGLVSGVLDANSNMTSYARDPIGRIISTQDALGVVTSNFYNIDDRLRMYVDGLGYKWTQDYDSAGRLTDKFDPNGNGIVYDYDDNGNLNQTFRNWSQNENDYYFDPGGRLQGYTDANFHSVFYSYDAAGRMTNVSDWLNHSTTIQYNAVGNIVANVNPLGITNSITHFDARNLPVSLQDALGNSRRTDFDNLSRPFRIIDELNRTNAFFYDPLGRVKSAVDPLGFTTVNQYDSDGNRTAIINAKSAKCSFYYDLAGNIITNKSALGKCTVYSYDARNQISQIVQPSGSSSALYYDANGKLTNLVDAAGSLAFVYDKAGRLTTNTENGQALIKQYDYLNRIISYTDASTNTILYGYDPVGNLTNLAYPNGGQIAYQYDSVNRLTNVVDWFGNKTAFAYDANNRLTNSIFPDGSKNIRIYDLNGRLSVQSDYMRNGQLISQVNYGYDAAGQIIGETNQPETTPYIPTPVTMAYDADNELTSYAGQTVTNDANGNMIYGPLTNGFGSYTYDVRNRLTGAGGVSYAYDPAGNRVAITNGVTVTQFVVNPNAALSQVLMRVQNGVTNYYVYGAGLLYEVAQTATKTNVLVHHYDYRGSTVAMTDGGGNVTDRVAYSPYGGITSRTGTNDTPFLYNGSYGVQTDANGLLYMRARYYNPAICRFVNPDPLEFLGGLNFYTFAKGNSISKIDPSGKITVIDSAIAAVAGFTSGYISLWVSDVFSHQRHTAQQYLASGLGGATTGLILANSFNPVLAASEGNLVQQGINNAFGMSQGRQIQYNGRDFALSTLLGGIQVKIAGVNAGANSWTAAGKTMQTRILNGTQANSNWGTMGRWFAADMLDQASGAVLGGEFNAIAESEQEMIDAVGNTTKHCSQ